MNLKLKCFLLFMWFVCHYPATAQELENISKQKPFQVSGGFGFNLTSTSSNDSNVVPMPLFWGANLNMNFQIYGISIPVSAVLTNGKARLSHSFNQFGMSPHYKWITLHAGYRQYSYSPFSVSGQTFFGGGLELNPSIFRLAFFGGRLRKALQPDSSLMYRQDIPGSYPLNINTENGVNYYSVQPSYQRMGWGGRIGFGKEANFVDFIFFRGYDDVASLKDDGMLEVKPEENVVLGINIFQRFFKHISFGLNGAASIYTYDTNAGIVELDIPYFATINQFIPIRSTTQVQWAAEANFNINYSNFNLITSYKRAEPYFRSMGISSFMTDLNIISVQPSWNLFKQKMRFANMFQYQTDNLNNYKQLTTTRLLLNSSVSYQVSNSFGINLNYNGNFVSQQKASSHVADSIQSSQTSNSFTISPNYNFNTDKISNIITLIASVTNMQNKQLQSLPDNVHNTYATLSNTLIFLKGGWNFNAGINYNNAVTMQNALQSYGFIAGLSKSLFGNSFTLSNNNTLLFNTLDGKNNGTTVSIDVNAIYNFLKRNTVSISFNYLYSPANGIYNLNDFKQNRLVFSYQYNF